MFFPFSLLPVALRRANLVLVQVSCRKLSVKLPLHLERARHHPRTVRDGHSHRAAVRGGRLHQPEREVKKRSLQGQRRKKRQHRDDDHSSKSKHRFHVCSPEVRWAVQLFTVGNGRSAATSRRLKMKDLLGRLGEIFVAGQTRRVPRAALLKTAKF
jgi:hypothetical protein